MAASITSNVFRRFVGVCDKNLKSTGVQVKQCRWFRQTSKACCDQTEDGSKGALPNEEVPSAEKRDPFPIFAENRVQDLLTKITGYDMLKVAGPHKKPLTRPVYKLLTDEELEQEVKDAEERLRVRLHIPPFMNARKPFLEPLAVDPDLAGFDTSNFVFTDVTFGVKDRDRTVVMRMTDGSLRIAPWDVKGRMNQIYNPREGREYLKPSLFKEEHLCRLMSEKKYNYILDRACCQFEPDDPDFIRTTHAVYSAVNESSDFDLLRSTRHFGSLAFYLVWYHTIDRLLIDMLTRRLRDDAKDLVQLYCIVNHDKECATGVSQLAAEAKEDVGALVKTFIATEGNPKHKSELELSLQALLSAERRSEES